MYCVNPFVFGLVVIIKTQTIIRSVLNNEFTNERIGNEING